MVIHLHTAVFIAFGLPTPSCLHFSAPNSGVFLIFRNSLDNFNRILSLFRKYNPEALSVHILHCPVPSLPGVLLDPLSIILIP
jgi:hypothetical protein